MEKHEFLALIDKYLNGKATLEDEQLLLNFYGSFQQDQEWDEKELGVKAELEQKMLLRLQQSLNPGKETKRFKLWPGSWSKFNTRIAAAAAILLVAGMGLFFGRNVILNNGRHPELVSGRLNDIAPGHNGATLTLANGKVIALSDTKTGVIVGNEKLAYNDGTEINGPATNDLSSGANAKDLTATTAKGQTYQITLPDGTKVWLNADSKLEFSPNFGNTVQRIVKLKGEAYFEVAKNKRKPFIVKSKVQETEVLGTHFNISAYSDEPDAKTTLLEGSVRIKSFAVAGRIKEVILKPNEQALIHELALDVKTVNTALAVAWKNNEFMFERESIENIMKMVERWYNVEVIYKGQKPAQTYSGSVSRFDNVSNVLRILEASGKVHFSIEGRKIYVSQ